MGGGLMQLVAYGAQDIYLTGNPQITFFKVVYRRHTNFSMECIQQTVNGTSTVGTAATSGTVTVSRNGDLLGKCYVRCDQDTANGINGDELITDVTLEIGGQQIDKHTKEWLQVWAELSTPESKAAGYKYLTGGFSNTLVSGGETNQQSVMVPLQFYFCRNPGLALPLIALQYHEVKMKFTFGIDTAVGRDGTAATPTVEVWSDYIYLDTEERRRFAQVSHEYLIEQLQYQTEGSAASKYKLNFNHPVKELVWTNTSTNVTTQKAKVTLNGHDRFAQQDREYFQLRQPLDHHTAVPAFNVKEMDRPVHVAPIDTTVLTHNATVADGAAKLEATQITFDSVDYAAVPVKVGDVLSINVTNTLQGSTTTANLASVADGDEVTVEVTVTGAALGDRAIAASSIDVTDFVVNASVTAANTVTVVYANNTGGALDLGAITTTVTVLKDSAVELTSYTVQLATVSTAADPVCTFVTAVPATHFLTNLSTGMGMNVQIVSRTQDPQSRCSGLSNDVNVYSFALKPEEHQPSGTCNFSRIDTAHLEFSASATVAAIYAVNYNVLRVMSGMGGLAYSN
jgi:hypothetical protein